MTQSSFLTNPIQDVSMYCKSPYKYASEGQNSPFLKDCLFVQIIIFGNKKYNPVNENQLFGQLCRLTI